MHIASLTATDFIRPVSNGRTRPLHLGCEDAAGERLEVVVKLRGNAVLHGGQVAIVPDHPFERYLVSQSQMKLTPDRNKVDPRFLYFTFTSADYRHYLRSNAVVTGVPHINLRLLREYPLSLPASPRAKSHRGGAWGTGRQDRIEPADERDA